MEYKLVEIVKIPKKLIKKYAIEISMYFIKNKIGKN